ncbi:MAG: c-type cytochrome [Gammaproteobacteria bacterium]|nr:c-type cytochrome [Gammaproteobacteria bacterium]MDD9896298.1 c-type cytochrome [Gammaproteobacteria bacterium]MDD9958490.1 c-type cytochrome [Gammaproteobacteria bacterium]
MKFSTSYSLLVPGSLASILALFLLLAGSLSSAQELGDHTYSTEAIERGSRIYSRECALCHGPQGDIVDGVNLRAGIFKNVRSDDDIRRVVTQGAGQGLMPGFGLSANELDGIIAYIRAGFDPEGVAVRIGDPIRGQELFLGEGQCADCHRVNGNGPRTAPDLSEIGAIRTPASLQRNLLDPAAAILPINRPIRIVTREEETVIGRRLNEDTYTVQVIDSNERLRSFIKSDLVSYEISMLPSKAPTTLSSDEVADVVGYLLTLRGQ